MFECIYVEVDLAINLRLKSIVEVKSYKLHLQVIQFYEQNQFYFKSFKHRKINSTTSKIIFDPLELR